MKIVYQTFSFTVKFFKAIYKTIIDVKDAAGN